MDGNPPASAVPRFGITCCIALLCWTALWIWTPSRVPVDSRGSALPREFDLAVPSREPLIDWNLFRFPALEVSIEGHEDAGVPNAGNLLALLEPQQVPAIANRTDHIKSLSLDLTPLQRPETNHPSAAYEQMIAGADDWFPIHGANHPWAVFGLNTSRAWKESGEAWGRFTPRIKSVDPTKLTFAILRHFKRVTPANTPHLAGPLLISSSNDRLAMVPMESASSMEPIRFAAPKALLAQLETLACNPWTASWANDADCEVRRLCFGRICGAEELTSTLARLDQLALHARELAETTRDPATRSSLMQAYYGLSRRSQRWQLAADLHQRRTNLWAQRSIQRRLLAMIETGAIVTSDPAAVASLRDALAAGRALTAVERRTLAKGILADARLASRGMDTGALLSGALDEELRLLATDTIDIDQLFTNLEELESTGSSISAAEVVAGQRQLRISGDERHRELAAEIEENYRNANFRVAVSGELLNRWLPEQAPVAQPVRERIAGSPVRGRAQTESELYVRLIPDPFVWRLGLEASGTVSAVTTSGEGSVAVRTQGATSFLARKLFLVRADGVKAWPAVAEADASQRLIGISSSYDGVPIMGSYVRSQANEEYHRRREQSRREVELKTANRARHTLDDKATTWLADIEDRTRARVFRRAEELQLDVTPIELRTTDSRLIARLRLANENQLSAYTPRPQAPADSLLSVQLHETAINNALEGLGLANQKFTAAELAALLAEKLDLPAVEVPAAAQRTEFHFDEAGAQARLVEGRLHITLAVREMVHDRSVARNFIVHAYYRPEIDGLSAKLVRDGSLQMEGRLRNADRARLHAAFGKVFDEDRPLELFRLPVDADAAQRLAGLMVTQVVIDDGWLGFSIGPAAAGRTAVRTRFVR